MDISNGILGEIPEKISKEAREEIPKRIPERNTQISSKKSLTKRISEE